VLAPALLILPLLCSTPPARVELVFGGDVIPHGEVKKSAADHARTATDESGQVRSLNNEGWDHVFGPIAEVLRPADVAMVNLETPVTGDPRTRSAPFIFNAPPAMLDALVAAGVDIVSVANNHAYDQRREGVTRTRESLEAAGLPGVGSGASEAEAWEPVFLERNGMRLGFLSFTRWLNGARNPSYPEGGPHVAFVPYPTRQGSYGPGLSPEATAELVRAAARRCDALFVSIHWGSEYTHAPHAEDRKLAQALLEAGALAIIGHHPHVLQPVEAFRTTDGRNTLVAYSLGNLIANQDRQYLFGKQPDTAGVKRDSMLLQVSLVRPSPESPVELSAAAVHPVWIENNHYAARRQRGVPRQIQPVLIDTELQAISERLVSLAARVTDTLPRQEARELQEERAALEQRLELSRRRREFILRITLPPETPPGTAVLATPTGSEG
jgi:poly-gamma-glutamate synthesis protein (capsule biosynthesis protein)